MKKELVILLGTVVCFFSGQAWAKEPLQPLTIQLNWVKNVEFAGVLVAKARGWYEEAGIDLTVKGWQSGASAIEDVLDGKAQIGVADGSRIIKTRAKGAPIKAIASAFQKSPYCLISKKEKGIRSPDQLAGQKVGFNSEDSKLMIRTVLVNNGLSLDDVEWVQRGWDLDLLIEDKIDAMGGYMNNEPLTLRETGYEPQIIPAFKHGYDFYSGVYFVTETTIQNHPGLVQKFVDATLRGWKAAFADPAATADLIVETYFPDGSVQQQTESLKVFELLATIGVGMPSIGYMETPFWKKGIDILHRFKEIDEKLPGEAVFTLRFLKSALPE